MVQNVWRHSHLNCQQAPIAASRLSFQWCHENVKITKSVNICKDIFWELVAGIIVQNQTDVSNWQHLSTTRLHKENCLNILCFKYRPTVSEYTNAEVIPKHILNMAIEIGVNVSLSAA